MSPWGYRGRIISLLAGVAASLLVVNSSDAECRVRFHTVNAYFVVVPIYVDGHGPFEFVVDTGTNTTLISADLATELNLKPIGDGLLATVTGPETVPRYFLDSVSLGTQSVPHLTVLAQRMKELQALNPEIRGVLGLDFLLEFAFLLDYGHQQIELYAASETPHISLPGTRQPLQLAQARILISAATEASVGGSWNLALDSGISTVAVFENAIRSSQYPPQDVMGAVRVTTNLSSISTSVARVRDLAIGDIHVRDLPVVILPKSPTLQRDVEDGLLPTMLFRYIFVNPTRSYVIFELNDAFVSHQRSWCMFCGNQKPEGELLQCVGTKTRRRHFPPPPLGDSPSWFPLSSSVFRDHSCSFGGDMKSRNSGILIAMALFAAFMVPCRPAAQERQGRKQEHRRYTVTDLGTLGGTLGAAQGINDRGWVVGFATLPGDQIQHSFLWVDGVMTDLGTLGGPNSGGDQGGNFRPNMRGEVPGFAQTSDPSPLDVSCPFPGPVLICLPFIWKDGVKTLLPTLAGINGAATAINNRGEAMGGANNTTLDSTCPLTFQQFKPVIWKQGEIEELPTVSGDPDGQAFAINDRGQVVGMSTDCLGKIARALFWEKDGTVTDIGNLGGANGFNAAFAINNRGQIVGRSDLPGDTTEHGFVWQDGVMTDLGTLPGYFSSDVDAINDRGQIAGQSCDINFNCSVVIVENGVMTDLNTLIPAGSPLFLFGSGDINSRGQIVGAALQLSTGEVHAFLATPCDEERAADEGCGREIGSGLPGEASQSRKIALPENVRKLLQQRGSRYHFSGLGISRN